MRLPLVPTIAVALAVATMIGLGIWQLQRAEWKQELLARYERAARLPPVAWPTVPVDPESLYFRRATGFCLEVVDWRQVAGRNEADQPGWAHIAACRTGAEGPGMQVNMGWSQSTGTADWNGGAVSGVIVPDSRHGIRLIADSPASGLQASKAPGRDSIPNNHIFYAVQWFFFAASAALIYLLALRHRRRERTAPNST